MAKTKKSKIKDVVETIESWVGMGPKAKKKSTKAPARQTVKKTKKKTAAPKKSKNTIKKK